jgi:hypothetical protein
MSKGSECVYDIGVICGVIDEPLMCGLWSQHKRTECTATTTLTKLTIVNPVPTRSQSTCQLSYLVSFCLAVHSQ